MSEDWEHMIDFADELLKHAETHRTNSSELLDYASLRISFVHIDHALELFMKAYLMKKGFVINKFKMKNGVKESDIIKEILDENKTIDFPLLLELFSKESGISNSEQNKIKVFHKYRNEIQHLALNIDINKSEKLEHIIPVIRSVYETVFTDRPYPLEQPQIRN